jgi:DNA-binding LacI/PurR family transcriptional regulator
MKFCKADKGAKCVKKSLDGKRTLGLFVTSAEDRYENALLRGVFDSVQEAGGHLICFTSGALRSYHGFESKRNILYDLVTPNTLDGLVVSGALGHNIGAAEMAAVQALSSASDSEHCPSNGGHSLLAGR